MTGQPLPPQLQQDCQARGERVWECVHRSAALGLDESYTLVLPRNGSPKPALIVLLHGSGRNHRTLVEQTSTRVTIAGSRLENIRIPLPATTPEFKPTE